MTDVSTCPPLGTGSIDFAQFHDALAKGDNPAEALAAAKVAVEPPVSLDGMTARELRETAKAEEVDLSGKQSNEDISHAILAKRHGAKFVEAIVAASIDPDAQPPAGAEPGPVTPPIAPTGDGA